MSRAAARDGLAMRAVLHADGLGEDESAPWQVDLLDSRGQVVVGASIELAKAEVSVGRPTLRLVTLALGDVPAGNYSLRVQVVDKSAVAPIRVVP